MTRQGWIEAAKNVLAGERDGILCPQNQDADLNVTLIGGPDDPGSEWHLRCPGCHVETFIRRGPAVAGIEARQAGRGSNGDS